MIDRVALTETAVTLDGRKAKITGYRNDFATVTALPSGKLVPRTYSVEFAWATAAHIVANREGRFHS